VKKWKVEILAKEKCIKPYVLTVVWNVKFRSNLRKEDLYTVKIAIRNTEDIESFSFYRYQR